MDQKSPLRCRKSLFSSLADKTPIVPGVILHLITNEQMSKI